MPTNSAARLVFLAAALFTLAACEERPSGEAGVEQEADQTGATEDATPPPQVQTDEDPTPQTGTGGSIPEREEGASQ